MKKLKRIITLTESECGAWFIEEFIEATGSTYPTVEKPNARDMVARLMQILKVGPVAPQNYPERVCIGDIEEEGEG